MTTEAATCGPTSPASAVDVWLIDLAAASRELPELVRALGWKLGDIALSPGADPPSRDVARVTLRLALAGYVGADAAVSPFRIAPGGKPSLGVASAPPIEFSLSHGETIALVAISRDGPVGVDVEPPRTVRIAEHRREALISAAAALAPDAPLPDAPLEARFLQAWTRLEALAKASGEGIGPVLERVRRGRSAMPPAGDGNQPFHVRDVVVRGAPLLQAAVAGTSRSLADGPPLEAVPFPLDRAAVERWLSGATTCGWDSAQSSPRD